MGGVSSRWRLLNLELEDPRRAREAPPPGSLPNHGLAGRRHRPMTLIRYAIRESEETGLELAVVQTVANGRGGHVAVDSGDDGTSFALGV